MPEQKRNVIDDKASDVIPGIENLRQLHARCRVTLMSYHSLKPLILCPYPPPPPPPIPSVWPMMWRRGDAP